MTETYDFTPGTAPLLVSMPHNGTHVPDDAARHMTEHALSVPDTDWHMDRLYQFAAGLGAGMLKPHCSRFVIDLNRSPDNKPLYPGASNTELCPTSCFDGSPIYAPGANPDDEEVARRTAKYWRPYHEKIQSTLASMHEQHGVALLFEAHSIRSVVPRFFDGRLPDLNLGTAEGRSCAAALQERLAAALEEHPQFSHVVNGRFKGGYITRAYGRPDQGWHAVQLEQSQVTYMDEDPPYEYRESLAEAVTPALSSLLNTMLAWSRRGSA